MDTESIKNLANDVNNVMLATATPLQEQIQSLKAKLKTIREQYAKDLVATNKFYYSKPICTNQPPKITNGFNACLSCAMRRTCLLIFKS